MSHLTAHLADLTTRLAGGQEMQDEESKVTLRFSAIISWTDFAQLRYILATTSPDLRFHNECTEALRRVVRLVEEMRSTEFLSLEAILLGVSTLILGFLSALKSDL